MPDAGGERELAQRTLAGFEFNFAGPVTAALSDGQILSEQPADRYAKRDFIPLNKHGSGPFGRFKVANLPASPGLYALCSDERVFYIGESVDLRRRWSASGYGRIQPRNCFRGGQETNCRVNALILALLKDGGQLSLYFRLEQNYHQRLAAEFELIRALSPIWNR